MPTKRLCKYCNTGATETDVAVSTLCTSCGIKEVDVFYRAGLKQKDKQDYHAKAEFHEEDYQQLVQSMQPFREMHKLLEEVYSTRSINAMFERFDKEFPDD